MNKRHIRLLKKTEGFFGFKKCSYRTGKEQYEKGLAKSFDDRKKRSTYFKSRFVVGFNSFLRYQENNNFNYSRTVNELKKNDIDLNKRILYLLATKKPKACQKLITLVKEKQKI